MKATALSAADSASGPAARAVSTGAANAAATTHTRASGMRLTETSLGPVPRGPCRGDIGPGGPVGKGGHPGFQARPGHSNGFAPVSHRLPPSRRHLRDRPQHPGCGRPLPAAYGTERPAGRQRSSRKRPPTAMPTSPLHALSWLVWAVACTLTVELAPSPVYGVPAVLLAAIVAERHTRKTALAGAFPVLLAVGLVFA